MAEFIVLYVVHVYSSYPGIKFHGALIKEHITFEGADIDLADIGLSISIPEQPLESNVDLLIRPCLSGPFVPPDGYEFASPVYIIEPSRQGELVKPSTVQIQHFVKLQDENDSKKMVFLSSSSKPTDDGRYIFKAIEDSGTEFKPGGSFGKIKLRHFCGLATAMKGMKEVKGVFSILLLLLLFNRFCIKPGKIQCKVLSQLVW